MKRTEEEYRHHYHDKRLSQCEPSMVCKATLRWPLSTLFVFLLATLAGFGWASIVYAVWLRLP